MTVMLIVLMAGYASAMIYLVATWPRCAECGNMRIARQHREQYHRGDSK